MIETEKKGVSRSIFVVTKVAVLIIGIVTGFMGNLIQIQLPMTSQTQSPTLELESVSISTQSSSAQ